MRKAQILVPILMAVFQAVSNAAEPLSITVERLGSGPIITPEMDSRMGGNIQGPSLIKVPDWVENPLGEYYLYFADHRGTYIRMAYADEVTGPWTIHSPGSLTLKESYFPKTKLETADDSVDSVAANEPTVEVGTDAMAAYTAAISKNVKSVKI